MKIAFICDLPEDHFPFWNDGLREALRILEDKYKFKIDIYNKPDVVKINKDYDVGIFWMALTNPYTNFRLFPKQALCFAGGPTYHPSIHNFDLIFAESEIDFRDFKRFGKKVIQAFGTNTKLFRPMSEQPKIYRYVYPAAFAKWKHHEKFAKVVDTMFKTDDKYNWKGSLAFGYIQPNDWEKECYEVCQKAGIAILPQVTSDIVPYIMNASENVYVGADINGGCQRTILEAKACNINVVVDSDSPKLLELKDLTHEEVLKNWSEESYAKKLKEGIDILTNGY